MKKVLYLLLSIIVITGCLLSDDNKSHQNKGTKQIKDLKKVPKAERILGRYEQELEMTADPATGKIPDNKLVAARKELVRQQRELSSKRAGIPNIVWEERGPSNVGGRTRAIMFDPNDPTNKKVWAGSVGGGLWYCDDITLTDVTWTKVDDFWDNLAVSAIAYDPSSPQTFYVGTGEAYGNADAIRGDGIWKTTDGGQTWTQLANTTSFADITEMIILADGTILAGNRSNMRRSTNGGSSWTTPTTVDVASLSLAADGDIYLGGFGGQILRSQNNGSSWTTLRDSTGNRVEVACAPSNSDVIYAVCRKSNSANSQQDVHWFQKSTDGGTTWSNINIPGYPACSQGSSHFTRGQGWYDLALIVHPTDADKIIAGGVDCHASSDGGQTWAGISNWTGGCLDYVHADIHTFAIRPGVDNSLLVGHDGGVSFSSDVFPASGNPSFSTKIQDYNVTQFYHGDIHPTAGNDYYLAGAQDNGTQRMDQPGIGDGDEVTGGDGAFTHIDQDEPNIQISAYVYNAYRFSTNSFASYNSVSIGSSLGRFINPTDYDWRQNVLYGVAGNNQYSYVKGIGSNTLDDGTTSVVLLQGKAECVHVSQNVKDRIYLGNGNILLKVDDAQSNSPTQTVINAPVDAYMSSVDIEIGNEDHIIISYSNYNVVSVWESLDGGSSWRNAEGDLPNMPVRSVVFDPTDANRAIVGTELGVWTTDNLSATSVDWDPTNSGLANVRTDMVRYRESDNEIMAATHGRGVYTSSSFSCPTAPLCYQSDCYIGSVNIIDVNCNASDDTYSADLEVTLYNTPSSGQLDVNGNLYSFTPNTAEQVISFTLTGNADGSTIDLTLSYTGSECETVRYKAFTAPTPGCGEGISCISAVEISESGTYNVPSLDAGGSCTGSNCTNAFWFTFSPSCDGLVTISSCGMGVDTRLTLHSSSGDCNTLSVMGSIDDNCSMGPGLNAYASELANIPVTAGNTYFIEWDDRWSSSGFDWNFTLSKPTTIFVDESATGDNTGCSWENAFTNLQNALNVAQERNYASPIWVAAGTYYPGESRYSTFLLLDTVSLYGGFSGTETDINQRNITANPTYLSGDIGIPDNIVDNSFNVVTISESTDITLDGFVITDGNADQAQWPNDGAGILAYGGGHILNGRIENCFVADQGAAIYFNGYESTLTLQNMVFTSNQSNAGKESVFNSEYSTIVIIDDVTID